MPKLHLSRERIKEIGRRHLVALLGAFVLFSAYAYYRDAHDFLADYSFSRAFYDAEGRLLRLTLAGDDKYRLYTPLSAFPPRLVESVLLKEDRYFYSHPGVNPIALCRAVFITFLTHEFKTGGSTLTMQLARLTLGLKTRSIGGKLNQLLQAIGLELFYSKDRLLEAYLNLAPCGRNVEGFPAAGLVYFGKPLAGLSLPEYWLLAVIPQDPRDRVLSPRGDNQVLIAERLELFKRWLTVHPADSNLAEYLKLPVSLSPELPFRTPHFIDSLLKEQPAGTTITTTIRPELQLLAERQLKNQVAGLGHLGINNASLLLIDYESMEVLACVGSADFFDRSIEGQVDGTEARRSPGSTLKPLIYARAIDQGLIHPKTMLRDAPATFGAYTPDNYQSEFKGPIPAEEALTSSRNIPAIRLAAELKNPDLYDMLKEAGVPLHTKNYYGLSIVLGSAEVTMKELARFYAALANGGTLYPLNEITEEKDNHRAAKKHNNDYAKNIRRGSKLFSREAAYLTLSMLETNPPPGAGLTAYLKEKPAPVAYKTGTSIGFKDCWSCGVFDNMVIIVWIGNFNGYGNRAFEGRKTAVPVMFALIDAIRKNRLSRPQTGFDDPWSMNLTRTEVCVRSGRLPGPHCKQTKTTWFIPGISPIAKCDIHRLLYIDERTGFQANKGEPYTKEEIWEVWPSDLLQLYREAGIPLRQPPPFPPAGLYAQVKKSGFQPKIAYPLSNIQYIFRLEEKGKNLIPMDAVTDGDVKTLYWFVDKSFIGESVPGEPLLWESQPGRFTVVVVDDKGRSDARPLHVITAR